MIIVTGGSGKVGLSNPPRAGEVSFSRVDITDFGQVMAALSGIDERVDEKVEAIVHLGAIASPGEAPDHVIFETNMISTYNVFEAARRFGIRNIVWASSETVYGLPYAGGPKYVPVDEEIEMPEWSYSLSKLMGEKLAEQFARWDPATKIIGLRLSNVQEPQDYANFESYQADAKTRHFNLWTYIDARDAAQAIRRSVEAKLTGAHVFGIANTNSLMRRSNDKLLDEIWPGVPRKRPLLPNESLISIEKAQRVLGYQPQFDWTG
jgi:nucleoside-diphosphate-sugar epimerase